MNGRIKYLSLTDTKLIWTPDIYFVNEKTGTRHGVLSENNIIRIEPNGDISSSMKVAVTLTCPLNLKKYPFDNQLCHILISSYGYSVEDMILNWKNDSNIQINQDAKSVQNKFLLRGFTTSHCPQIVMSSLYSCIDASFEFSRQSSWCLVHVFIPANFFVVLSYISLWLDGRTTRYQLAMGSLLFHAVLIALVNLSSIPKTSFTKAVDVWTIVCLTMSFTALLILIGTEKYAKYLTIVVTEHTGASETTKALDSETGDSASEAKTKSPQKRLQSLDREKLENGLLALYPMVYLTFIVIFWIAFGRRQQILQL
jgi:hypothetical protein